ncbi:MAG: hypothetical protein LBO70_05020 [Clostridiales Family XIII bacterium]|jgi:hypothetical protein|nr:hypothetical protein [Clostridiales Family XIII bacterium]
MDDGAMLCGAEVCGAAAAGLEDVFEEFIDGDGHLVTRPLTDIYGYVCGGRCAGCPIGPSMCERETKEAPG